MKSIEISIAYCNYACSRALNTRMLTLHVAAVTVLPWRDTGNWQNGKNKQKNRWQKRGIIRHQIRTRLEFKLRGSGNKGVTSPVDPTASGCNLYHCCVQSKSLASARNVAIHSEGTTNKSIQLALCVQLNPHNNDTRQCIAENWDALSRLCNCVCVYAQSGSAHNEYWY